MANSDPQSSPDDRSGSARPAQAMLPQVQPPTATFILQLFLIPLVIVSCVVLLFLGFRWLASATTHDPAQAIQALKDARGGSWQKAYELADVLGNSDRQFDKLRESTELAQEISKALDEEMGEKLSAPITPDRAKRRMFLCRTLGMFKVGDGLPSLTKVLTLPKDAIDTQVQLSALESISMLAKGIGPDKVLASPGLLDAVLAASKSSGEAPPPEPPLNASEKPSLYNPYSEVRAVAAYTLGVIGGPEATKRLNLMLADTYPNARFNAAIGLARQGNVAAIPVLSEMLDPDNELAVKDERYEHDQERKRTKTLYSGLQSLLALHKANPSADITSLVAKVESLSTGDLPSVKFNRSRLQQYAKETHKILVSAEEKK